MKVLPAVICHTSIRCRHDSRKSPTSVTTKFNMGRNKLNLT